MAYCNYNGNIIDEGDASISADNRAFKFADGFFETIKVFEGEIILKELHFHRLYTTLEKLKFPITTFPKAEVLEKKIIELVNLNNSNSARIRITIFAGNGSLLDISNRVPNYLIQALPLLQPKYFLNTSGIEVDFFKEAIKPCDHFSSLKTNNFLPYVMASLYANEKGLDDAILFNQSGTIADATIANVFVIKDGIIITPPLQDGPVGGVMRKYLLHCFKENLFPFKEESLTIDDVLESSEVFLTNVIIGIKSVRKIQSSNYTCKTATQIFKSFVANLTP